MAWKLEYFLLRQELKESQSASVHPFVRLVLTCLEPSIFSLLASFLGKTEPKYFVLFKYTFFLKIKYFYKK